MELLRIYASLSDVTRLRLLAILGYGPLCVCHFQTILREPQVKISKHLRYLRDRGLVACERRGNWMVYSLPSTRSLEVQANLKCLRECTRELDVFQKDAARLKALAPDVAGVTGCACESPASAPRRANGRSRRTTKVVS